MLKHCLSGPTVIGRESTSGPKFVKPLSRVIKDCKSNEPGSAIRREREPRSLNFNPQHKMRCIDMAFRHVIHAAQSPMDLDDRQVNAVSARIELDLRLGAAFTRYQTLSLQMLGGNLAEKVLSYGENEFISLEILILRLWPHRILPVSNPGLRSGQILSSPKIRAREILEHQSYPAS